MFSFILGSNHQSRVDDVRRNLCAVLEKGAWIHFRAIAWNMISLSYQALLPSFVLRSGIDKRRVKVVGARITDLCRVWRGRVEAV